MNNRLYVGNLSFQTSTDAVRAAFESFGAVEDVHLVTDRETGRPRGFGFVTMSTAEEAQKAIEGMDGQMLDGRPLRVNQADERPRGGGGRCVIKVGVNTVGHHINPAVIVAGAQQGRILVRDGNNAAGRMAE